VRFGKAVPVQHQPDQHLFAIAALVPRVAALRLGIAQSFTLEVRRGQIVEITAVRLKVEQNQLVLVGG
jgi:hypothetical protein